MLYFNTMQAYLEKKSEHRPSDKFYMIFSTMMLFLITIFVATQSFLGQEMWIINAGYPGGALAYFVAHVSAWYQTMGSVASILLQLMTDVLLVSVLTSLSRKECIDETRFIDASRSGVEVTAYFSFLVASGYRLSVRYSTSSLAATQSINSIRDSRPHCKWFPEWRFL